MFTRLIQTAYCALRSTPIQEKPIRSPVLITQLQQRFQQKNCAERATDVFDTRFATSFLTLQFKKLETLMVACFGRIQLWQKHRTMIKLIHLKITNYVREHPQVKQYAFYKRLQVRLQCIGEQLRRTLIQAKQKTRSLPVIVQQEIIMHKPKDPISIEITALAYEMQRKYGTD